MVRATNRAHVSVDCDLRFLAGGGAVNKPTSKLGELLSLAESYHVLQLIKCGRRSERKKKDDPSQNSSLMRRVGSFACNISLHREYT